MPRNKLTELTVRTAKPKPTPYKLSDGAGLYLLVSPNGSKYWRLKYRLAGKEKVYAIGSYPDVSLSAARQALLEARVMVKAGNDPVAHRRKERLAQAQASVTFEDLAREWMETHNEWSQTYRVSVEGAFVRNLFPRIGKLPIAAIDIATQRSALLAVEKEGKLDTLRKLRMWCSQIFKFAIATGRAATDPAAPLQGTFKKPQSKPFSALTKKEAFGELIKAIRTYEGSAVTRIALQLMALTFLRTKELRHGRWSEIDLETKTWTVPWLRMKGKKHGPPRPDHIIPLSQQAVALLIELKAITGHGELLFPKEGDPSEAMSENTMLYALYRLGYHKRATVHGFRASASTLLNEMGFDEDAVERQLGHVETNKVRRAYHRAEYLDERRNMMQQWADMVQSLATYNAFPLKQSDGNYTVD